MLEHLGLPVHPVPRHAEALDQVQLEQAVMANHLERHAPAVVGQLYAPVGLVLGEPELGQPLDHPRGRAGVTPSRSARALVVTASPARRSSA